MSEQEPDTHGWLRIPARRGVATRLGRGECITVNNQSGTQVVDTWAFAMDDMAEYLSMEHSRVALCRLVPRVGDTLVSNRRSAMLAWIADTTDGAHDTLMAACDSHRYRLLGAVGYHDNCTDNLHAAIAALGLRSAHTPSPLNLFMNVPWRPDGGLEFAAPRCAPGQYVTLRAEQDLIVAFSACPQDMNAINGGMSRDALYCIGPAA